MGLSNNLTTMMAQNQIQIVILPQYRNTTVESALKNKQTYSCNVDREQDQVNSQQNKLYEPPAPANTTRSTTTMRSKVKKKNKYHGGFDGDHSMSTEDGLGGDNEFNRIVANMEGENNNDDE